jgi:hypothetical protein
MQELCPNHKCWDDSIELAAAEPALPVAVAAVVAEDTAPPSEVAAA